MSIICPICSELLKGDQNVVSTKCGHVFHHDCLESWLRNARTCPTCRQSPTLPSSLIRLYFEMDESREALRFDDVLKTNDELNAKCKDLEEKLHKAKVDLNKSYLKLELTSLRESKLNSQKKVDDMEIAGLKSLKDDAIERYTKLTESFQSLKLDYLAERQLRRSQQVQLGKLVPEDDNYDTTKVQAQEPNQTTNGVPEPSEGILKPPATWHMRCEPTFGKKGGKEPTNHLTSKISSFRAQRSAWKNEEKPKGYSFTAPTSSNFTLPSSSTSNNGRLFGETGNSAPDTSKGFDFLNSLPSSSKPRSFSLFNSLSSPLQSYRDVTTQEGSPPSSPQPSTSGVGPKASER